MNEVFTYALLAFTSFFTLINPVGIMPVFMTMTNQLSKEERKNTALRASFIAFCFLLFFAITGQSLFRFFGISIDSLRVVGGMIFFLVGFDMLQARLGSVKVTKDEIHEYAKDVAITPLAIPIICGPGSIANSIILMDNAGGDPMKIGGLILAITAVLLITCLSLLSASSIMKVIGDTGNKLMLRLMGLIVMVMAVEFFFAGIGPLIERFIMK
ncbi:MarC family protein [Flammeovirga sp. SJP92]|uniref:MarC family protein n=1 Tax=Flammeovirga sp. SJP92 TaxID=1775430 RepID=UPI0007877921|nr:MarC family protein [Flammeovirga sp. SJP92]KXX68357.1 antibiotic resistance protein MarC [Flammeovirga sp. SJP92]